MKNLFREIVLPAAPADSPPAVYVAAATAGEAEKLAGPLRAAGVRVVSGWHADGNAAGIARAAGGGMDFEAAARRNLGDLRQADWVLVVGGLKDGRAMEAAAGLALGKRVAMVSMPLAPFPAAYGVEDELALPPALRAVVEKVYIPF